MISAGRGRVLDTHDLGQPWSMAFIVLEEELRQTRVQTISGSEHPRAHDRTFNSVDCLAPTTANEAVDLHPPLTYTLHGQAPTTAGGVACCATLPLDIMLSPMTTPRMTTVLSDTAGYYHCVSRCVRRAWLCGQDPLTGKSFEHRRGWVESRLEELSEVFATSLYAYAVMNNHVHVVVRVDPLAPLDWSDEEVAARWCSLSRDMGCLRPGKCDGLRSHRESAIVSDPERLVELRRRLGSLSWFMRFLNESIARAANREDGCTGRFWEGRFHCQFLADEEALLGCMAYVDLNPIRAGLAMDLEASEFTSIRRRVQSSAKRPAELDAPVGPLSGQSGPHGPAMSLAAYVALLEWTGRQQRGDKPGRHPPRPPTGLERLACGEEDWRRLTTTLESTFGVAVGNRRSLVEFASATGRRWVHGVTLAWQ